MKTNIEKREDQMEKWRIDYVIILIVLLYWLGIIWQTIA